MNLKQLSYFMAIAEEQQITAAARRLHISQPPLSYELAALERELGVQLVKRGPRRAELTDAGKLLYRRAGQILSMTSSAAHEVESFGKGFRGVLSIGAVSSSGGQVPGPSMRELAKGYPDVRIELHEGNTFQVIDMLDRGIVDVGVVRTPFNETKFETRHARPEPMCAVMRSDAEFGANRASVTLEELAEQPIAMYRRFEPLVREVLSRKGLVPFIACLNDDARTTCIWARQGLGVGLVPKSIVSMMNTSELVTKDVDCEALMTAITLIWEKDRYLSPLAQRFIEQFELDCCPPSA